jgi:hypothetical protein
MAVYWTNRGVFYILNNATSGSTDIRQAVYKGASPSQATVQDWNFVSDITSTEAAASGYARADLAGVTLAEDDTANNVTLVATAPTYTSVAVGETWTHVAYYVEAATDGTRTLLCIDIPAASVVTNGGNIVGPALSTTITAT